MEKTLDVNDVITSLAREIARLQVDLAKERAIVKQLEMKVIDLNNKLEDKEMEVLDEVTK